MGILAFQVHHEDAVCFGFATVVLSWASPVGDDDRGLLHFLPCK